MSLHLQLVSWRGGLVVVSRHLGVIVYALLFLLVGLPKQSLVALAAGAIHEF